MWEHGPCAMLIRQIHLVLGRQADNELRQHNLTMSQIVVLLILNRAPDKELSLKELEQILQVSQPDVVGIVSRLEKKKMVERFTDAADRRVKRVKMTPFAEPYCVEAEVSMIGAEKAILSGMTEDEKIVFRRLLQKALDNLL